MKTQHRILPLFIPHLGCPNQCVFCNQKRISGSLFPVSGEDVRRALLALGEEKDYELAFYGGSFTAISAEEQRALLEAAQPFRRSGTVTAIRVSTRPDAIDAQRLALLREMGVTTAELGAQSMTEAVLRASCRGHSAADVERAAAMVKAAGFRLVLQMMTGLPGETEESCLRSAERLIALQPDAVRIYPTVVLRHTPLYDALLRGEYREHSVEEAVSLCARLLPLFEAAGIPVIRLGLNPTEELSGGEAVGGAYHPALGELVYSRCRRNECEALLQGAEEGSRVSIFVPATLLSQYIGQKRCNVLWLQEKFRLRELKIRPNLPDSEEKVRIVIAK